MAEMERLTVHSKHILSNEFVPSVQESVPGLQLCHLCRLSEAGPFKVDCTVSRRAFFKAHPPGSGRVKPCVRSSCLALPFCPYRSVRASCLSVTHSGPGWQMLGAPQALPLKRGSLVRPAQGATRPASTPRATRTCSAPEGYTP